MTMPGMLCAGSVLPKLQLCQQLVTLAPRLLLASHASQLLSAHQFHSSRCSAETESSTEEAEQPEASTSGAGSEAAAAAPKGPVHARHISLNDPELNIYLRHNVEFITDPDRAYAIGHRNAFERITRQEVRKALAAQRLYLKDTAAAVAAGPATAKQPPMQEQMLARLSELQEQLSSSSSR